MEFPSWLIGVFGTYIIFNFIWSVKLSKKYKKFIKEKPIFDEQTKQTVNLHDLYPEFKRYDSISFYRIFLGLVFFFWFKMIVSIFICLSLWMWLK